MKRAALYFWIAALPVIAQTESMPSTLWGWVKLAAATAGAGLIALKALESTPTP